MLSYRNMLVIVTQLNISLLSMQYLVYGKDGKDWVRASRGSYSSAQQSFGSWERLWLWSSAIKDEGKMEESWRRGGVAEKPRSFIPKRDHSWAYGNIHQLLITEPLTCREIMEKWYAGYNLPSPAVITPWKQLLLSQEQAAETDSYQLGDLDLLKARVDI